MTEKRDKLPPDVPPPAGQKHERRSRERGKPPKVEPGALGRIGHDDLGNAVWTWRVDVPRRRDDDPTLDLLDSLDVDGLSIEDEDEEKPSDGSFNPYDKTR